MSVNDQFYMGRIPIKPLPFKNKEDSQCNEIMIDYGENGTYHIYITHHSDKTQYIDITNRIINEMIDAAHINADMFTISIDDIDVPQLLRDIINFIYKRFVYPDNIDGYDPTTDGYKITGKNAKSVLLKNKDGTYILPVTLASNVFDEYGNALQDRLDNITKIACSTDTITATEDNQTVFTLKYPFKNYPDYVELRIGGTVISKNRYQLTNNYDENNDYTTATITFINESIENGRTIDVLFIYNSLVLPEKKFIGMSGVNIADKSIPYTKLEKISDSYTYPDLSSVASSKALNDLYELIIDRVHTTKLGYKRELLKAVTPEQTSFEFDYPYRNYVDYIGVYIGGTYIDENRYTITNKYDSNNNYYGGTIKFNSESIENNRTIELLFIYNDPNSSIQHNFIDESDTNGVIKVKSFDKIKDGDTIKVVLRSNKKSSVDFQVVYSMNNSEYNGFTSKIYYANDELPIRGYRANTTLTLLYKNNKLYLMNPKSNEITTNRDVHLCVDQEYIIPYSNLNYYNGDIINVYRNGVRLFRDIDYSMNENDETITLFVRTEEGERIIFETISML